MNTETQASGLDTVKLAVALASLCGAVFAFYWYADQSLLMRVLGLIAVAAVSILIASQTALGRSTWTFIGSTRTEVRKVVWPSRQETIQTTLIVFAMVLVMGIVLWLFDMLLLTIVRAVTG